MRKKIAIIGLLIFSIFYLNSNSQTLKNSKGIITLATGLSNPNAIATDSTFIYWVEYGSGSIKKISNTGGTVTTLVSGLYSPTGICLDNNDVYFGENYGLNSSRIKKVPKIGGAVTTIISNLYSISQLALDNTNIYFGDFQGNKIQKIMKSGGTVTTLSTQTYSPTGIVLDDNNIYWTEFTNPGTVKKVSKSGGTTITLGNNSNGLGIAVDNLFVYWTENVWTNQGKINKVPIAGGSVTPLATGLNYAWDLCIDDYNVYWVENRINGAVKQIPVNGGSLIIIANGVNEPVSITSDNFYIYWIERNGGTNGSLKKADKYLPPPPPNLLLPPNNSIGQPLNPLLDWDSVTSATSYNLKVASDSNFTNTVVDTSGIISTFYHIPFGILQLNTKYFWKVNSQNIAGSGAWSSVWNFSTIITSIKIISHNIPKVFELYQNYPNPFNPVTNIKFDIPSNEFVTLKIYDILGKEVTTLVNEKLNAGSYKVEWNAINYQSGVYFYKLITDEFVDVKKMIFIK